MLWTRGCNILCFPAEFPLTTVLPALILRFQIRGNVVAPSRPSRGPGEPARNHASRSGLTKKPKSFDRAVERFDCLNRAGQIRPPRLFGFLSFFHGAAFLPIELCPPENEARRLSDALLGVN